ncbi:hypothetical protein D1007_02024 [Hordeum vulgare]|nr:hypothetical protein D1007_02024 [Hordeum vulgare]
MAGQEMGNRGFRGDGGGEGRFGRGGGGGQFGRGGGRDRGGGGGSRNMTYSVQSPGTSDENVEVIPTPPAVEEVQTRFSKRIAGINMEHVGIMAEKMTKKRNLQGKEVSPGNYFEVLSNLEIISTAAQMGVNIRDDNFVDIDIIRELEMSRANIEKKKPVMMEVVKKGAEMLKENASQMLLLCGPPMPEATEQANEEEDREKL